MLLNLTPHPVTFYPPNTPDVLDEQDAVGLAMLVLASHGVARAHSVAVPDGEINTSGVRLPVSRTTLGQVHSLPAATPGTSLLVSLPTFHACPQRPDLVIIDRAVRDMRGQIIGARGLARPATARGSTIAPGDSRSSVRLLVSLN